MDYYSYNFNPNNLNGDSVSSRRRAFFRKTKLNPKFFRGKRVLEIGPGEGWDMLTMLKSGARTVDSLEYSRGIVRDLKTKFRNYPNIRVSHGDAMKLPFKASEFDFVYANGVLPHVKDPLQALKEMVRVTRKGGILWFSVYGKKGANNYLNRLVRSSGLHVLLRPIMHRLLRNASVKPIMERIFPRGSNTLFLEAVMTKYFHAFSQEQLVSWCKGLGSMEIERVFPNYGVEVSDNWLTKLARSDWIQIKSKKPE